MKISSYFKNIKTRLNRRGIILMYHRIADLEYDPWWLAVTPKHFEEHMQVLKKYGRPVKMQEFAERLECYSLGQADIAVTFDDGYSDNFHFARPILEKYQIPATFFITTNALTNRVEFWWDEIGRLILVPGQLPKMFNMVIRGKSYTWRVNSVKETLSVEEALHGGIPANDSVLTQTRLFYVLWKVLSEFTLDEKKVVLAQIAQWAGQSSTARVDHLSMTIKELEVLASNKLFEIGAHSINHPMLAKIPLAQQEKEIVESRRYLEKLLNKSVTNFAYPHGNYSTETLQILKDNQFQSACTVEPRVATRYDRPLELPRFGVTDCNGDEFEQKLKHWLSY